MAKLEHSTSTKMYTRSEMKVRIRSYMNSKLVKSKSHITLLLAPELQIGDRVPVHVWNIFRLLVGTMVSWQWIAEGDREKTSIATTPTVEIGDVVGHQSAGFVTSVQPILRGIFSFHWNDFIGICLVALQDHPGTVDRLAIDVPLALGMEMRCDDSIHIGTTSRRDASQRTKLEG